MTIIAPQNIADLPFVVIHNSGMITACTEAFATMVKKVVMSNVAPLHIQSYIHSEDLNLFNNALERALGEDKSNNLDIRIKTTKSSFHWFEIIFNIHNEFPNSIGLTLFSIDKRKKEFIQLSESLAKEKHFSEMKSKFVSTTSHEFRTPLSIIKSSAEVMLMFIDSINDEKIVAQFKRYLVNINNEADRLTHLINDVLVMQKADTGVITCNKVSTDIVALIKNTIERQSLIQKDGRVIDLEIVGQTGNVFIDPILFEYIMDNLFSNAFKYSQNAPNPQCKISFTSAGFYICIKDFGIGIPKEEIAHLFSLFFRGNNVGAIKGTGLGLNIVNKLVELHKGSIRVSSRINEETEFILCFPNE